MRRQPFGGAVRDSRTGSDSAALQAYERQPLTFYRGTVLIMTNDPGFHASHWHSVQCVGDAHIGNFGIFPLPFRPSGVRYQ